MSKFNVGDKVRITPDEYDVRKRGIRNGSIGTVVPRNSGPGGDVFVGPGQYVVTVETPRDSAPFDDIDYYTFDEEQLEVVS